MTTTVPISIIFWMITLLLLLFALAFVLPWIKGLHQKMLISVVLALFTYGLYFYWGNSQHLAYYYSIEEQQQRAKQTEFRKMLAEFRKQEFRLRLRIEENPADVDAEWRLLDLLAIKAIQKSDYALAVQYWQSAIQKIPKEDPNGSDNKERLIKLIKIYKNK